MATAPLLTPAERNTLNAAMEIIGRHTPVGASWQFDSARYADWPDQHFFGITYFDSNEGAARGQHSSVSGETFADKVQAVIGIEARASVNAEKQRAMRLEQLRKELAQLEQAA